MGRRIEDYEHGKKKLNNPDVGLVNASNDSNNKRKMYQFDPHLDPELNFSVNRREIEKILQLIQEPQKSCEFILSKQILPKYQNSGIEFMYRRIKWVIITNFL